MAKHRKVRMSGNSWIIALTPTDGKDNNLDDHQWADIEDVVFKTEEQLLADKNITKLFGVDNEQK